MSAVYLDLFKLIIGQWFIKVKKCGDKRRKTYDMQTNWGLKDG